MGAILGISDDNQYISIPDENRNSGLYILGKPRMGKSWLIVNLILQNIEKEQGIFFLDPHGQAITDIMAHDSSKLLYHLFDPENKNYSFGINLFECSDIEDARARVNTFARAKGIFDKLWKNTFEEKPWLQLILQNTIYAFIENQGYTLAEFPLFFRDSSFRAFICNNIKYNVAVLDYWLKTFASKSRRDQNDQMEAAQTRAEIMLAHPYVLDIVGQSKTTIPFDNLINSGAVILLKLSASLPYESKQIIGTILISELLHAVRNRPPNQPNFYIYIDEFQNFASFEDFSTLITQAPKYNICTTIAHHDRYGQLLEDPGILGATAAICNKALFQTTVRDASELAVEFAEKPPYELKREPELSISMEPVEHLLKNGHKHPAIQRFVTDLLIPWLDNIKQIKEEVEARRLIRMEYQDQAISCRDSLANYRLYMESNKGVRGNDLWLMEKKEIELTNQVLLEHNKMMRETQNIEDMNRAVLEQQERVRKLKQLLIGIMTGRIKPERDRTKVGAGGNEEFAQALIGVIGNSFVSPELTPALHLYILIELGDPKIARSIHGSLARLWYPSKSQPLFLQKRLEHHKNYMENDKKEYPDLWSDLKEKKYLEDSYKKDTEDFERGYLLGFEKDKRYPLDIPDLPPRVFDHHERMWAHSDCRKLLGQKALMDLEKFVDACFLFIEAENHILVRSGQYALKEVPLRTEADMVGEKIREITELEKYTAYAKVLNGAKVWKGKIRTRPLKGAKGGEVIKLMLGQFATMQYLKERRLIEREIRKRQENWKPPASDEPPIPHS